MERSSGPTYADEPADPATGRFPEAPPTRTATDPIRLSHDRGPSAPAPAPPRRRGPALATAAVLLCVGGAVGVATWRSQQPEPVAAPPAPVLRAVRATAPAADPTDPGSAAPTASRPFGGGPYPTIGPSRVGTEAGIEAWTREGTGVFSVAEHRWTDGADGRTTLEVRVGLSVQQGRLSYDPDLVKVFDADGRVHSNTLPLGTEGELGSGTLLAGGSAQGWLAYDVPRGPFTVVLSSWNGDSVAALRLTA